MSRATFEKVMSLCSDDYITLGGGEPTLHKRFLEFLVEAIANCESVHVITNGSIEKSAIILSKLSKSEVISAELSFDKFHNLNLVSPRVQDAFADSLRNTSKNLIAVGRAKENDLSSDDTRCCCDDIFCTPLGVLYSCGCKVIKIGSVHDEDIVEKICYYNDLSDNEHPCGRDFLSTWNNNKGE